MNQNTVAPKPRFPKVPQNITLEQFMPVIRDIARRKYHNHDYPGLAVTPGKKFIMVCDSTNNKVMIEALTRAITELGGRLDTIMLKGNPGLTEPIDLLDAQFSTNWLPDWTWQAMLEADTILMNAFLLVTYTPGTPKELKRKTMVTWNLSPDLCLPLAQSLPAEVVDAVDIKTWEALVYARKIELTDLEGTELRWSVARPDWEEAIVSNRERFGVDYNPGHQQIPLPGPDAEGKLVTSAITFGGPVPRVSMTIKGSRVTEVEGQGKFAEALRRSFEEYREIKSARLPGPGINWWTTLALGTSPKFWPASGWDKLAGSGRMRGWGSGHSRSGIVHTSVGEGVVRPGRRIIRHVDLFFPTLIADGKKIIENGHLTALDNPEIIKLAGKYGDPEKLLREDWIPAISGVNA